MPYLISNRHFSSEVWKTCLLESLSYDFGGYDKNVQYIGMVRDSSKDHMITLM